MIFLKIIINMNINIQSAIDVITNSSTSIYTIAGDWTLDRIKEIINTLLQIAKSDLTADDLFEFKLNDPSYYDSERFQNACEEYVRNNILNDEELEKIQELENQKKKLGNPSYSDYSEKARLLRNQRNKIINEIWNISEKYITRDVILKVGEDYEPYDEWYERDYSIIAKQNIEEHKHLANILSNLENLFNIEANYNS